MRRNTSVTVPIPHRTLAEIAAELNQKHNQAPHACSQPAGNGDVTTRIETIKEPS